jgi:aminoglycoside phosphotransferase (APT) family kinase protein
MTWLEQSRALRATVPTADGLDRLGAALGEPVELVGPLYGGVASSVHHLRTPTRDLVLKRYLADDDPPPIEQLEWERLRLMVDVPIPTPVPIALDTEGAWFGRAALVMSHLPGRVAYPPPVESIARTMARLHDAPLPDPVPEVLRRPGLWTRWEQVEPYPDGVVDAIAALPAIAERSSRVLAHCDLHPGNVLVEDGEVTGVVDWSGVRLAPRAFDVALTRCDLAIQPGGDAPAVFLAAYEGASGVRIEHLAEWDCLAGARAIQWGAGWTDCWTDVGVAITVDQIRERATRFCEAALS